MQALYIPLNLPRKQGAREDPVLMRGGAFLCTVKAIQVIDFAPRCPASSCVLHWGQDLSGRFHSEGTPGFDPGTSIVVFFTGVRSCHTA